ncbi:MAG: ACP S-malonyltransferase [Phycisphaerae bacterium]|nr:ACP S-malonyltransferase [Phycisphaerae bacterium]
MAITPVILCPGQGAQALGMGKAWFDASPEAASVFAAADRVLGSSSDLAMPGGATLSSLCFGGPIDVLSRTDVSQPALFTAGVACYRALAVKNPGLAPSAAAGLSLGEYTALHLAGALSFEDGLRLVALRGKLMQQAAEASKGSMVALIGADETQAQAVCDAAAQGDVLVCANFNAPGQIVLSGHLAACQRAVEAASTVGCRATPLQVAGAFHSPLMAPAAEGLAKALASVPIGPLAAPVWSNVTAEPHASTADSQGASTLRKLLVEQLVSPVRWAQSCVHMLAALRGQPAGMGPVWEMAPGNVLKGLMRRIDRSCEVLTHDQPS